MSQTSAIDAAFKARDLAVLKRLVAEDDRFPDELSDRAIGVALRANQRQAAARLAEAERR